MSATCISSPKAQEVDLSESKIRQSRLLPGGSESPLPTSSSRRMRPCWVSQSPGRWPCRGRGAAGSQSLCPRPYPWPAGRGGEAGGASLRPQREQKQPSFCFNTSRTGSFTAHGASEFRLPSPPAMKQEGNKTSPPTSTKHKPPARLDRRTNKPWVRKQAPHPGGNRPPRTRCSEEEEAGRCVERGKKIPKPNRTR